MTGPTKRTLDSPDDWPSYGEVLSEKTSESGVLRIEGHLKYPKIHGEPYIAVERTDTDWEGQTAYVPFDRVVRIEAWDGDSE